MRKLDIRLSDLSIKRLRRLAHHAFELSEARLAANDALFGKTAAFADQCPPALAKDLLALLDEWGAVQNTITEKSNKEVRRITGAESVNN